MTVEVAFLISVVSACFSIFFGLKSSKHTDVKDIENRVAEMTKVNVKLDGISRDLSDLKEEIRTQRKEFQELSAKVATIEASAKSAHRRIDDIIKNHGGEE